MNIVIVSCFDSPSDDRTHLLKDVLECEGHRVSVITSNFWHIQKSIRTDCPDGFELVPVRPYFKNLSAARLRSHADFSRDAITLAGQKNPDLLWVLVPPNSLVRRAVQYKHSHPDVRLVFDLIDLWPESLPGVGLLKQLPPFSQWRGLRDRYINAADLVVTECSLYWDKLRDHCDQDKLHTLYWSKEATNWTKREVLPPEGRISLCYLGSINNIIDIPCIGEIIRNIDLPVTLHIIGKGERKDELIQTAQKAGAEVIFHGAIYDSQEKKKIFDQCHFGLNIMKDSVSVGLTIKSIDYFDGELPIINNIKGDTWKFVQQYPIGINYSPNTKLDSQVLLDLQKNRHEVRTFFEQYLSKDAFQKTVCDILFVLG